MHTVEMTVTRSGRVPVPGTPSGYVPGIMRHEASLLEAIGDLDAVAVWLQAGGYSTNATPPISERNAADGGLWTAANNSLVRDSNGAVMGGRKRLVTSDQTNEGLRGVVATAPDTWDGYTIIVPDVELNSFAANNCLFSIGTVASARPTFFFNTSGRLALHNGSGGNTVGQGAGADAVVGQRYSVMATYRAADGAAAIYRDSTTPRATGTLSQGPGSVTSAAAFGSADNNVRSNLKASQIIVLKTAITDSTQIAAILSACAAIRSFTA